MTASFVCMLCVLVYSILINHRGTLSQMQLSIIKVAGYSMSILGVLQLFSVLLAYTTDMKMILMLASGEEDVKMWVITWILFIVTLCIDGFVCCLPIYCGYKLIFFKGAQQGYASTKEFEKVSRKMIKEYMKNKTVSIDGGSDNESEV